MKIERDPRPVAEVLAAEGVFRAVSLKHVASLLYTYRCNIACRHCLFNCGPRQPDVRVSHEDGIEFLHQLHATDRVIHIAGGEALIYYDEVLALCRAANEKGVAPHFIETNGKLFESDTQTAECLGELREAGVTGLYLSTDPYHQASVPSANRERAERIAMAVFGRENVTVTGLSVEQLDELGRIGRSPDRVAEQVRKSPPRMVGRAAESLARYLPERPIEELVDDPIWHGTAGTESCATEFDPETMWEIHLDPYGNVQTCCGIVVGNVHETSLPDLVARGFHTGNDLVRRVFERGPYGLLELATEKGFEARPKYVQKCHLCWEVRKFLREFYPDSFGPAEVHEYPARA